MSIDITDTIRNKFESFCYRKLFPSKNSIKIKPYNKYYLQVQAGYYFGSDIHYEYTENKIHFHIEFEDNKLCQALNKFLEDSILDKDVFFINNKLTENPDYKSSIKIQWTLQKDINTESDLWNGFIEIKDIIEPYINKFEELFNFHVAMKQFDR